MARANAANVQRPGSQSKTAAPQADATAATEEPVGVAAAAESRRVDGPVDPTKLSHAVMTEAGWVCPAKPEQITVAADETDETTGED